MSSTSSGKEKTTDLASRKKKLGSKSSKPSSSRQHTSVSNRQTATSSFSPSKKLSSKNVSLSRSLSAVSALSALSASSASTPVSSIAPKRPGVSYSNKRIRRKSMSSSSSSKSASDENTATHTLLDSSIERLSSAASRPKTLEKEETGSQSRGTIRGEKDKETKQETKQSPSAQVSVTTSRRLYQKTRPLHPSLSTKTMHSKKARLLSPPSSESGKTATESTPSLSDEDQPAILAVISGAPSITRSFSLSNRVIPPYMPAHAPRGIEIQDDGVHSNDGIQDIEDIEDIEDSEKSEDGSGSRIMREFYENSERQIDPWEIPYRLSYHPRDHFPLVLSSKPDLPLRSPDLQASRQILRDTSFTPMNDSERVVSLHPNPRRPNRITEHIVDFLQNEDGPVGIQRPFDLSNNRDRVLPREYGSSEVARYPCSIVDQDNGGIQNECSDDRELSNQRARTASVFENVWRCRHCHYERNSDAWVCSSCNSRSN